jgi:hypothetical protein
MSWYRAPLWDLWPDVTSCRNVAVWNVRSCLERPLWWEDGSAICSVITQWSESPRTGNHTLLSHLRLPQPGAWGQVTADGQLVSMSWYRAPLRDLWPDITSCRNVAVWNVRSCLERPLWWEDGSAICNVITQWSESPRTGNHTLLSHLRLPQRGAWGQVTADGQLVSMSWYRAPLRDLRPDITSCRNVWNCRSCFCGAHSLTRVQVCN